MSTDRRILISLFAIAFGLRILYAVVVSTSPTLDDPTSYEFRTAARIAGSIGWINEPFSPSAPGYPLALGAWMTVFGATLWSALFFNIMLAAATTFFVYRIGERCLGRGSGLLAAIWFGVFVHHIIYASVLSRDVAVVFVWMWILHLLTQHFYRMRASIWLGILSAVLVHIEPAFLLFIPLATVALFLRATHHRLLSTQYAILFLSTVFVVSLPWTVRNAVVYGEVVPIAFEAQQYLPVQKSDAAPARATSIHRPGFIHNVVEFWRVTRFRDAAADPSRGIAPQPAWSGRHNAVNIASFGLLLPLAAVGALIGLRRRNRAVVVLTLALIGYAGLMGFLGATDRSRLPAEPIVLLLAFHAVATFLNRRNRRNESAA